MTRKPTDHWGVTEAPNPGVHCGMRNKRKRGNLGWRFREFRLYAGATEESEISKGG